MDSFAFPYTNTLTDIRAKKYLHIRAEQDFILFGKGFADFFLEESSDRELSWFAEDGDCVLKGQTPLRILTSNKSQEISFLLKAISYLSGGATLVRCYGESAGDLTITGSSSKDSPFPDWEEKAIHMGGGVTNISCVSCSSEKAFLSAIKRNPPAIALDISVFSVSDCETYLKDIPDGIKLGICGPILPEDVMKFLHHPLDFIMPSFLQEGFPSVQLAVNEE